VGDADVADGGGLVATGARHALLVGRTLRGVGLGRALAQAAAAGVLATHPVRCQKQDRARAQGRARATLVHARHRAGARRVVGRVGTRAR
jgi:hypothetical protein